MVIGNMGKQLIFNEEKTMNDFIKIFAKGEYLIPKEKAEKLLNIIDLGSIEKTEVMTLDTFNFLNGEDGKVEKINSIKEALQKIK